MSSFALDISSRKFVRSSPRAHLVLRARLVLRDLQSSLFGCAARCITRARLETARQTGIGPRPPDARGSSLSDSRHLVGGVRRRRPPRLPLLQVSSAVSRHVDAEVSPPEAVPEEARLCSRRRGADAEGRAALLCEGGRRR